MLSVINKVLPIVGSLLPVVMPRHEFKPKRLVAVIVMLIIITALTLTVGEEKTEFIFDQLEETVDEVVD